MKEGVKKPKDLIKKYYKGPGKIKDDKTLEKEK